MMHEINGSEGEHNRLRVKRTRRVFPRPTYKASSACALTCSGRANSVRTRAIAFVDFFPRGLSSKNNLQIPVDYKDRRSDSARLILPSEIQAHFLFRIRYYDGLRPFLAQSDSVSRKRPFSTGFFFCSFFLSSVESIL